MRVRRIGVLACVGVAIVECRPDQVAAPTSAVTVAVAGRKSVTGSPVTYSSLSTGVMVNSALGFRAFTVIGLQSGTGKPYGITLTSNGWSATGALPNPSGVGFTAVSTGPANSGNLQVVGFTSSGTNYLLYQGVDEIWHWVGALPGASSPPAVFGGRGQKGFSVIDYNTSYFFPGAAMGSASVMTAPWQDENATWQAPTIVAGFGVQQFATGYDVGISPSSPYVIVLQQDPRFQTGGVPFVTYEVKSTLCPGSNSQCGVWRTDVNANFEPAQYAQAIPFSMVATARGNGSNMQAILLGANDGQLYLSYNTPNVDWAWYGALPNPNGVHFTSVVADTGNNGSLQVIGLDGASKQPMLTYLDNGGHWHWFGYLPDPNHVQCQSLTAGAANNGGNLQVVCLGLDGLPYLIWQSHSDGSWHWYGALPQNF